MVFLSFSYLEDSRKLNVFYFKGSLVATATVPKGEKKPVLCLLRNIVPKMEIIFDERCFEAVLPDGHDGDDHAQDPAAIQNGSDQESTAKSKEWPFDIPEKDIDATVAGWEPEELEECLEKCRKHPMFKKHLDSNPLFNMFTTVVMLSHNSSMVLRDQNRHHLRYAEDITAEVYPGEWTFGDSKTSDPLADAEHFLLEVQKAKHGQPGTATPGSPGFKFMIILLVANQHAHRNVTSKHCNLVLVLVYTKCFL